MIKVKTSHPYSFFAFIAIAVYFIISFFVVEGWKSEKIITSDRANYYVYLPATFIYSDLHFTYADSLNEVLGARSVTFFKNEEGMRCQKMPVGVSVMESPFFLVAHAWATLDDDYESNGYSEIYFFFIILSGLFYALMATYFIRKILLRFSTDKISAIVILLIAGATNVLYYATYIGGISHMPGLFLVSAFIWYSIKWVDDKRSISLALALLAMGLAIIVRPTNAIFSLFLVFYIFESDWNYSDLIKHISSNISAYLLSLLCFLIPIFIQMALWKYISGDWIQYSYRDEGFFFSDPNILSGLFGGRNSLIPYTPFLIFAFLGLLTPIKRPMPKYSLLIVLSIFFYVIYSWWCWWYGGSVGSRAAIESYVLLALLLAYFLAFAEKQIGRIAFYGFIFMLLGFSLFFARLKADQYKRVIMHWDSMTYRSYWDILLNSDRPEDFNDHLKAPDYANAKKTGIEYPGFKEMTLNTPFSDTLRLDLAQFDWSKHDSLTIRFSIWGKYKLLKKSFVQLELDIPSSSYKKSYPLHTKTNERSWNKGEVNIFIPSEMRKEKLLLYYHYLGDFQCYYQDLSLVFEMSK